MKHIYEPEEGRGYISVQPSNIPVEERFSVYVNNVGMSANDLVEFGKWASKIGREQIKQDKADAKALQEHLETKAGIAAAIAIASLNIQPKE
jgi:hypothetical protein